MQFLAWASGRAPLAAGVRGPSSSRTLASLELVAYTGRPLGRLPVLLVLTRRQLPSPPGPRRRSRRPPLARCARGRDPRGTARRRRHPRARQVHGRPPPGHGRQIVQLAGGSPLLAAETARAASTRAADLTTGDLTTGDLTTGDTDHGRPRHGRPHRRRPRHRPRRRRAARHQPASGPARVFVEFLAAAGRDLDRSEVASLPLPSPGPRRHRGPRIGPAQDRRRGDRVSGTPCCATRSTRRSPTRSGPGCTASSPSCCASAADRPTPHGRAARPRAARRRDRAPSQPRRPGRTGGQPPGPRRAGRARRRGDLAEAAGFLTEALRSSRTTPSCSWSWPRSRRSADCPSRCDRAFDRALEQIAPQDSGALVSAWLRRGRWLRGGVCHPRESRRSYQNALDVLDREPAVRPPRAGRGARGHGLGRGGRGRSGRGRPTCSPQADRILGGDRPGDLLAHDIGVARGHALIRAGLFTDSFGPLIAASAAAGRAGRPDMAYSCLSNAASAAACAGEFGRALDFADRCLPLVIAERPAAPERLRADGAIGHLAQAGPAGRGTPGVRRGGRVCSDRVGLPELDGLVEPGTGPARPGRRLIRPPPRPRWPGRWTCTRR